MPAHTTLLRQIILSRHLQTIIQGPGRRLISTGSTSSPATFWKGLTPRTRRNIKVVAAVGVAIDSLLVYEYLSFEDAPPHNILRKE